MRRFWVPLTCSITALLLAWNALLFFFPQQIYAYDYAVWQAKFDLLAQETEAPRVLVLGDSSAVSAIHATDTKRKTLNLGLGCGGPVETSYMYDFYRAKLPTPRVVVILVTDLYFHSHHCYIQYLFPFDQFPFTTKIDVINEFRRGGRRIPVFGEDEKLFDALHVPGSLRDAIYLGLLTLHLTPNQITYARNLLDFQYFPHFEHDYDTTMKQRGLYVIGNREWSDHARTKDMQFDSFVPNPVILKRFENLIAKPYAEGAKVIVRLTAWNPPTQALISANYKRELRAYLDAVASRFPNAHIEREARTWPSSAFGDDDIHLNRRGALLETTLLEELLDQVDP